MASFLLLLLLCSFCASASPYIGYNTLGADVWRHADHAPTSCDSSGSDSWGNLTCGGSATLQVLPPFDDECAFPSITCSENGYPEIEINSITYKVQSVDYKYNSLVITNVGVLLSSSPPPCPPPSNATSDEVSPFHYTDGNQWFALLSNCSGNQSAATGSGGPQPLQCASREPSGLLIAHDYVAVADGGLDGIQAPCERVMSFAVKRSAVAELGILGAVREGFEVTWADVANVEVVPADKGHEGKLSNKMIIGCALGAGCFVFVCLTVLVYLCCFRKPKVSVSLQAKLRKEQNLEAFLEKFGPLAPTRYSYSDLENITSSFSEKLGQGGFGAVYKGKLHDGTLVAVKVLNHAKGGTGKEFFNEVISIGCTYHINIVSLLGFCLERSKRALVYEFMPNGSLDKFIFSEKPRTLNSLGWSKLFGIALGIARGLDYLHRGCNIGILHFDIKPHNILLDHDFCPKIADFGLAKLSRSEGCSVSMLGARGTAGYIAPEVFSRNYGGVSSKSDVYSYGMMVLEMVGGRNNIDVKAENTSEIYFPNWIYRHLNLDGGLKPFRVSTKEEEEIARRLILIALWCIQTRPADRPSMSKVVDMLEGRTGELQVPPIPVLSSPTRSPEPSPSHESQEIISVVTH